ncbi:hypothetical protein AMI01nite_58070 [Aneurinibacillus migulanus]|nr:hypothetical protein AMI01nite_58070 [Aneurinibacillus migulanus]
MWRKRIDPSLHSMIKYKINVNFNLNLVNILERGNKIKQER